MGSGRALRAACLSDRTGQGERGRLLASPTTKAGVGISAAFQPQPWNRLSGGEADTIFAAADTGRIAATIPLATWAAAVGPKSCTSWRGTAGRSANADCAGAAVPMVKGSEVPLRGLRSIGNMLFCGVGLWNSG